MQEFSVGGMNCAACSARVESAVSKVEGVTQCAVSLLTNSMRVEGKFRTEEVIDAVEKVGYTAALGMEKKAATPKEEKETGLFKPLLTSLLLLLCLMYVSMEHMFHLPLPAFFSPMAQGIYQFLISLSILFIHRRFFIHGIRALWHRSANMDTLVALGSGVSFCYSTYLLCRMIGKAPAEQTELLRSLYFESAAMILVLITVGKMLEAHSKGKTTDAIRALQNLSPQEACVLSDGEEKTVLLSELLVGDLAVVRPGQSIPADGVLVEGEGAVDESALTGESIPVDKTKGDALYTGTVGLSGKLTFRVEKVGKDTALSRIIDRVTAATASKAPIARLADRVSRVFVPVVMTLSLITLCTWLLLGETIGPALSRAIAVLVVSCPCALGLATPVAIMVANGVAARHGILFKTASGLEEAGKTKIVVLDKTGTVTTGDMKVTDVLPAEGVSEDELILLASSVEEGSVHPIAAAVTAFAEENNTMRVPLSDFSSRTGFGVEGVVGAGRILGGKKELLEEVLTLPTEAVLASDALSRQGKTPLFFAKDNNYLGCIALSDPIKASSPEAVLQLKNMGLRVVMITGDREEVAKNVASLSGIDEVFAGVLPEGKENLVQALKAEGKVMMVGDGINDAPALSTADLGVAIGAGVDVAMDASEVVLMNSTLSDVPKLIDLSRKTLRNIKENLFWAFCYNLIGIPLAAGVFYPVWGWSLTPMFGAAAMSISSFLVVSNALRLNLISWNQNQNKRAKKKEEKKMEKIVKIEGMMCPHCEAHVKKALEAIPGVVEAIPSHEKKEAVIRFSEAVSDDLIDATIEKEGYRVL